jgi:DNA-binding response OmpR family regulator
MISHTSDLLLTRPLDNETRRLAVELLAQLLRNDDIPMQHRVQSATHVEADKIFTFGEFTFDPRFRRVTRGKCVIPLTLREYELLAALAARAGAPVSKNVLRVEVWQNTIAADSRSIDQHVSELRRKLRSQDSSSPITTTRKYGYSLNGNWVARP